METSVEVEDEEVRNDHDGKAAEGTTELVHDNDRLLLRRGRTSGGSLCRGFESGLELRSLLSGEALRLGSNAGRAAAETGVIIRVVGRDSSSGGGGGRGFLTTCSGTRASANGTTSREILLFLLLSGGLLGAGRRALASRGGFLGGSTGTRSRTGTTTLGRGSGRRG